MALYLKENSLFLHIPKTGGSWVTQVLKELGLVKYPLFRMHGDMDELHWLTTYFPLYNPKKVFKPFVMDGLKFRGKIRESFKFCFVRHPISWYESFWRYQMSIGWERWGQPVRGIKNWHPNALLNDIVDSDFNTFVDKTIRVYPGYVTEMYGSFTRHNIDFVGKQESLVEDLIKVLYKIGFTFDESSIKNKQKINVSKHSSKVEWDEKLKEEVIRLEYAAIKKYGYQ